VPLQEDVRGPLRGLTDSERAALLEAVEPFL